LIRECCLGGKGLGLFWVFGSCLLHGVCVYNGGGWLEENWR
jgi:hypothetical protein